MQRFESSVQITLIVTLLVAVSIVSWVLAKGTNDLPAWVQAVGSIAAIGAAVAISNAQHVREKRNEAERQNGDERRKLLNLREVMNRIHEIAQLIVNERTGQLTVTSDSYISALRSLHNFLERLPIFDVPEERAIMLYHQVHSLIPKICNLLQQEHRDMDAGRFGVDMPSIERADGFLKVLVTNTELAINLCTNEIIKRNS